jgi:hypothetical protein
MWDADRARNSTKESVYYGKVIQIDLVITMPYMMERGRFHMP